MADRAGRYQEGECFGNPPEAWHFTSLLYRWRDEAEEGAKAALGGSSAAAAETEKDRRIRTISGLCWGVDNGRRRSTYLQIAPVVNELPSMLHISTQLSLRQVGGGARYQVSSQRWLIEINVGLTSYPNESILG